MKKILGILLALALVLSFSIVSTTPVAAANGPPVTTGLVLHLDASDSDSITKDGDNKVSEWADLSTAGNDAAQATAANQPLWVDNALAGKPVIRFDGTDDRMFFPRPSISCDISIFVVFRQLEVSYDQQLVRDFLDENAKFALQGTTDTELTFRPFQIGTSQAQSDPLAYGYAYLGTGIYDGVNVRVFVDGVLADTVSQSPLATAPAANAVIGHDGSGSTNFYFDGDIAEILIYNRALSDSEREQVEQYLGVKWLATCLATATSTGTACFHSSQGAIEDLTAVSVPSGAPGNLVFPHGMFEFRVTGLTTGQITMAIELPSAPPAGTRWWKYHNGSWYSLPIGTTPNPKVITIQLTDDGLGDSDTTPGQITDPGGPGSPMAPAALPAHIVGWETYPLNKATILAPWIALLAAIMAGLSLLLWKRRRAQI